MLVGFYFLEGEKALYLYQKIILFPNVRLKKRLLISASKNQKRLAHGMHEYAIFAARQ